MFSVAASGASSDIRRIDSGDFKGDEADTYRDKLNNDLPPHLDTTSQAWSMVSSALQNYASTLESLQQRMATLSAKASDQQSQVNSASNAVADAHTADSRHTSAVEAQTKALKPGETLPADTYKPQSGGASSQLSNANSALQATTDAANQVRSEHNAAVDTCANAINQAAGTRFEEPPGFWGKLGNAVGGWIRDHADVLTAISSVLKQISGIAGLLAMIPVLAPIMGPIALATGAGALVIDGAVMLATGKGSVVDLVIDAAGLIPGGRAAGEVAKGADALVGATRTASTVVKDARGVETVASGGRNAENAVAGVDRAGSRAADGAGTAARHDTPADSLPCAGDPIDVVTGEMIMIQTDLELPGVLPLTLKRVYKSSYRWGGSFGHSWASTLDQRVEIGSDGGACFVAEDGVVLYYPDAALAADGIAFWPTEGIQRWPLRRIAGGGWTVEDPDLRVTRRFAAPDADDRCALLEIIDHHGNSISFDYGNRGLVSAVRHSAGYRVDVDSVGSRVTGLRVQDGSNHILVASFGYDLLGNMLRVNNSDGDPLRFDWESERIVGWRDRNDIWYRYEYDEEGRCVRTSGRGRVLSYGFSYLPGRTLVTDSLGGVTTYEYNHAHQVTREIDPLGNVTASVWDRHDHLLVRTDPLGRSTQFEYDGSGRLVEVTYPDGLRELLQRNFIGFPVRAVDVTGAEWTRTYDGSGNLVSTTDPLGAATVFGRNANGAVASITDPLGATTAVTSNAAGLPASVSDPLGGTTRFEYDGFGRVVRSVDPLGGVTTLGWTGDGKLAFQVGPDGAREEWTWDGEGNLTSHTDATGARTVIENGVFDLPVVRIEPDGGRMLFGYDTELRLTSVQNPAGLRWRYDYDAAGRLAAETDFNGRLQQYRHDAAGRLITMVNGLGQETVLGYNTAGDLVERTTIDGMTRMEYDRAGRLLSAESPGAVVDLDRDACGRVVRETVNGHSVTATFDAAGQRISRTTPSGVLSQWGFDAAGRPQTLQTAGQQVTFAFDAAGREVGRSFSAGGRLEQTFDAAHRLVNQVMGSVAGAVGKVGDRPVLATARSFRYRIDGALAGMSDGLTGSSRRFDLDSSGRVVGVQAAWWTESYVYDRSGNVTAASVGGAVGANPAVSAAPAAAGAVEGAGLREYAGTLVTRAGGVSYGHDRQGRVVTRTRKRLSQKAETWRYRYDADDRMVAAISGDQRWAYNYDVFGRRISKQRLDLDGGVLEQTLFAWDGDRLIEQSKLRTSTGADPEVTTWEYLPGSWRPVGQTVGQTVGGSAADAQFFAIVSDLVGTPTELVTPDGSRVAWRNAESTVWGAPRTFKAANGSSKYADPAVQCPIRFPGQYADDETGLHYNRHRYYDPAAARYTTSDPLGLAPADDPHSYVVNPTGWSDPLGLTACPAGGAGGASTPPRRADFIANADGVVVSTSRSRMEAGFRDSNFPSKPTTSPGTQYEMPDGSLVRIMEPAGPAPLRASFTDSHGQAVSPFTGRQPHPPAGVSGPAWKALRRDLTHVELGP
ncbi:RHS repeat-associated protein [Nakamurella sp. UYEF19]